MKALIWISYTLVFAFILTLFKWNGIMLGGIPTAILFALYWFLARKSCSAWDVYKSKRKPKLSRATSVRTNTKFCSNCGNEIDTSTDICNGCGKQYRKFYHFIYSKYLAPKERYCKQCGKIINNSTNRCIGCGKHFFDTRKLVIYIPMSIIIILCLCILCASVYLFTDWFMDTFI